MQILSILLIAVSTLHLTACEQGIKGQVLWLSGNQMPGPGTAKRPPHGIKRNIFVHKATGLTDVTQNDRFYSNIRTELVAKTTSDKDGFFKIDLPPGEYSIFVEEPGGYFANLFDEKGRINVVKVNPGKYTQHTITVDYEAAY